LKINFEKRISLYYQLIFIFLSIFFIFSIFISVASYYFPYITIFDKISEDLLTETNEFKNAYSDSEKTFEKFLKFELEGEGEKNLFVELFKDNIKILSSTKNNTIINKLKNYNSGDDFEVFYATLNKNPDKFMIIKRNFKDGVSILIGENLKETLNIFYILKYIIIFINLISFFTVTITILIITKKILNPIKELSDFTKTISEKKELIMHMDYTTFPLELYNLADNFKKMLNRIHILINEAEELSDNIAHDIKTPLTNIKMITENLLSEKQLLSHNKNFILILKNLNRTTYIINTILSASKIISDTTKIDNDKINLLELSKDAFELFYEIAESKNIKLSMRNDNDKYFIKGNLKAVQRIISNIIDNSIKYTNSGGSISINLSKNKNYVFFSVKDSGIGIPENEIANIFNKFYKIDKSRQSEGIGLGLSIVKSLVEKLNAEIFITSTFGTGSEFIVKFKQSEVSITKI